VKNGQVLKKVRVYFYVFDMFSVFLLLFMYMHFVSMSLLTKCTCSIVDHIP